MEFSISEIPYRREGNRMRAWLAPIERPKQDKDESKKDKDDSKQVKLLIEKHQKRAPDSWNRCLVSKPPVSIAHAAQSKDRRW